MNEMTQAQIRALNHLPIHMREGATRYLLDGIEPGGFQRAVLENNLHDALGKADHENRDAIFFWACWLNVLPMAAWGSRERIDRWIAEGGLRGLTKGEAA